MVTATAATAPSVFGYTIRSTIDLRFLRSGGGISPLEICEDDSDIVPTGELLGEWQLHGTAYPAYARLLRVESGYEYVTSDAGMYRVDIDRGRISVPRTEDALLREQRLHGIPMVLSFLARGDLSLHAAAVEVADGAVILGAPSRHGKSTLAMAFQRAGHRVLSEDLICCRPSTVEAIPGPALLRIRPDVHSDDLPNGCFVVARRSDRVFVGFDAAHAGSSAPVPIKAIVFLREGLNLAMQPAEPTTALKDLWQLNFRTGTGEGRADAFRSLSALISGVRAWNVTRPLKMNSLSDTVDLIYSTVR